MVRENSRQPVPRREEPYPADKARGAYVELRQPWQRAVFIGGLFGTLIVAYLILIFAG
jgi:hypothetical protein